MVKAEAERHRKAIQVCLHNIGLAQLGLAKKCSTERKSDDKRPVFPEPFWFAFDQPFYYIWPAHAEQKSCDLNRYTRLTSLGNMTVMKQLQAEIGASDSEFEICVVDQILEDDPDEMKS